MGLFDSVKGFLNIGGVTIKLQGVAGHVSKNETSIPGQLVLTTKSDKHVISIHYKFINEQSRGSGEDKETDEIIIGETFVKEPFDIKTGETKTLDFAIPFVWKARLKEKSGMLGAVGKLGAMAMSEKEKFYVVAEADVKGTPLDPSDKVMVQVVD